MLRRARGLAVACAVGATTLGVPTGPARAAPPQLFFGPAATADGDFGAALALGDANRDGHDDLLVGAPGHDAGRGYLMLLLGGPDGLADPEVIAPAWEKAGTAQDAHLGQVVCALGDVNGDGLADFAVGEPDHDAGRGRVWVFIGTATGLLEAAHWDGFAPGDRFGANLLGPGDVDGDGYSDLLVGSPDADAGAGHLVLYRGAVNLGPSPAWLRSGLPDEHLGATLARVWDVDGDGYADFLAGGTDGAALYRGAPDALPASDDPVPPFAAGLGDLDGDDVADLTDAPALGLSGAVHPVGDLDGDGIPDAWAYSDQPKQPLHVVSGDTGEVLLRPACYDCFAWGDIPPPAVAAGDVDGDGYADLVYAVHTAERGGQRVGAIYLARGGPQRALRALGPAWPIAPGPLGPAGDLDGDGFADVLVTAAGGVLAVHHGGPNGPDGGASLGVTGHAFAAADLDGNGRGELVIASGDAVVIRGLVQNPDWRVVPAPGQPPQWIAAADVDGDGYVDVLTGLAADLGHPAILAYRGDVYGPPVIPTWRHGGPALAPPVTRLVSVGRPTRTPGAGVVGLDDVGHAELLGPLPDALDAPLSGATGGVDVRP
ncbi:MAG: hypothetical protein EP329_11940, partial [Deltaproteobacteria bacterium]